MRALWHFCIGLLFLGAFTGICQAETFQLLDGSTISGEVVSYNGEGLIVRQADNSYSDRISWEKFSQPDLKKLAGNPKIAPLVDAYIEITPAERRRNSEIRLNPVPRLERPAARSLVGALFSSGIGVLVVLLVYAGNIYAAHEIAIFRARPRMLVCGIAAVAPVIGPIIFLSLPTQMSAEEQAEAAAANLPPPETPTFAVPTTPGEEEQQEAAQGGGLRLAHGQAGGGAGIPQTQVFARGAFTFNRRFIETKFPGFFGMIRRDAEKDMVLQIKAARGTFVAHRITRITANDMHMEVHKGAASQEVMVPFSEIQEIQLKHKDA